MQGSSHPSIHNTNTTPFHSSIHDRERQERETTKREGVECSLILQDKRDINHSSLSASNCKVGDEKKNKHTIEYFIFDI